MIWDAPPQLPDIAPPWLLILEAEIGTRERRGWRRNNPRIIEYHATTRGGGKRDEIPWCSSVINWSIQGAGFDGTRSRAAKSWIDWGEEVAPRLGAITVIRRRKPGRDPRTGSGSGWHVGLWVRPGLLLGGNQSDSVRYSYYEPKLYDVIASRWISGGA